MSRVDGNEGVILLSPRIMEMRSNGSIIRSNPPLPLPARRREVRREVDSAVASGAGGHLDLRRPCASEVPRRVGRDSWLREVRGSLEGVVDREVKVSAKVRGVRCSSGLKGDLARGVVGGSSVDGRVGS